MKIALIVVCIAAIIFAVIKLLKKKTENTTAISVTGSDELVDIHNLVVPMQMLPAETSIDDNKLIEIKDSRLIKRVESLVPGTAQALNNVQAVEQANEVMKAGGKVYQAVLKNGGELVQSKDMQGAVRGFTRNANGIEEMANLVPVDGTVSKLAAANIANAAMGVGSMVVGQYYMTQINAELDKISDSISNIEDFQKGEYRSKVFALVGQVQKISVFQYETMDNDELRNRELILLQGLEKECTELLGQANLKLAGYTDLKGLDYNSYAEKVREANDWYQYQQMLTEVLYRIGDLTFALNMGKVSREHCYAMYPTYLKQTEESLDRLNAWHEYNGQRLGIDVSSFKRKRDGLDAAIHWIPSLFDKRNAYRDMSKNVAHMIEEHSSDKNSHQTDTGDLFNSDVKLIAKDGKLYYLPET